MRMLAATLTALIALVYPGISLAAEMFTPLVFIAPGGGVLSCTALNVSDAALQVRIEIRDRTGTLIFFNDNVINPGAAQQVGQQNESTGFTYSYCKYIVDGKQSTVRAGALLNNGGAFIPAE